MWTTQVRPPSTRCCSSARGQPACVKCVPQRCIRVPKTSPQQQLPTAVVALGAASAHLSELAGAAHAAAEGAAAAAAAAVVPVDPSTYVPSPMEPSWQVWFGAFVGVVPFAIGAYEFTKRILIQRRCRTCEGSGLVMKGKYPKKCPECGGMFPWVSWRMFLSATATPGNGGPLMQPKGQTSIFYSVPPPRDAAAEAGADGNGGAAVDGGGGGGADAGSSAEAAASASAAASAAGGGRGGAE